jgi:hypothetical protein
MRIGMAIRLFFKVLFDRQFAGELEKRLDVRLDGRATPSSGPSLPASPPVADTKTAKPRRSDAVTLLATLQREARLIDMVREPLGQYTDAQVGAAAREVLRDCGRVLDRLFGLEPLVAQEEGSPIEVPAGFDAGHFRLTGSVSGTPPFRGRLVHHGWLATRCELPTWSGSQAAQMVVAPQEVEVSGG